MGPGFAALHAVDLLRVYAVVGSDAAKRSAIPADTANSVSVQLGVCDGGALRLTTFCDLVVRVVPRRPDKEVIWITASRRITTMKHLAVAGSMLDGIGNSVRIEWLTCPTTNTQNAVPVRGRATCPEKAASVRLGNDAVEQAGDHGIIDHAFAPCWLCLPAPRIVLAVALDLGEGLRHSAHGVQVGAGTLRDGAARRLHGERAVRRGHQSGHCATTLDPEQDAGLIPSEPEREPSAFRVCHGRPRNSIRTTRRLKCHSAVR